MFGIGSTELLVIFVVALIVLGPKSIPQIAKTLGKAMGEFKRVSTDFQRTMNAEVEMEEHEKRKKEAEQELFGDKAAPAATGKATATASTVAPAAPAANAEHTHDTATTVMPPVPEPVPAQTAHSDTFAPDSPLAKAVAKAEAEAAAHEAAAPASAANADKGNAATDQTHDKDKA